VILDEILAHKRQEVAARSASRPLRELVSAIQAIAAQPQDLSQALRQPGVSFIAEIKRKSPSGGEIRPGALASDLAQIYAASGAAALSVLTDAHYFGGSDEDLVEARAASGLPVLRKDFVVSEYQLYEARLIGADAVLLIVRALSDTELRAFLQLSEALGLDALVETHSAEEVHRALGVGARIIGVNNRDLDSLVTDVSLAPRLRPMVPAECVFVAESGISQPDQIQVLHAAGVDAVLIGESLLRSPDPGEKLRALVQAGAPLSAGARSAV
jgi:indole-3-glycerol phosphate synthase